MTASENRRSFRALAALLLFAWSCDRSGRESAPLIQPSSATPRAVATQERCTLAPHPARIPLPKRAVAIGDLHGDLSATRSALRAAGAIDERYAWIGGELVVIQLGDVLDRGDDESQVLELLDRLDSDARAVGGAVIMLLGNHELMNAAHDFRYVTRDGATDFGGDRKRALAPGGPWAKRLARRDVIAIVGDTILSHAGIVGDWATKIDSPGSAGARSTPGQGVRSWIDEVNLASRCWLDGQAGGPSEPPPVLVEEHSPVWTRAWGMGEADCTLLDQVLANVGAKRMVVGHTVQERGVTSACGGKLWRIDVGLAKFYGGPIEVLELDDPPKVLRGTR